MNKINSGYFVRCFRQMTGSWKNQLELSLQTNLDLFISEAGGLGEYLAHLITGKTGNASAGSGFDLIDEEKKRNKENRFADEAKMCVNIRGIKCGSCNIRYLFWKKPEICSCGENLTKNKYKGGGRFGIDAEAGVEYHKELDKYIVQSIDPVEYNKDCRKLTYRAWIIDAYNPQFVEYVENQYYNAKANNCNLLPYSYDFYRAEPVKVIELLIDINDDTIIPVFFDLDNTISDKMNINLLKSKELTHYNLLKDNETNIGKLFPLRNKNLNKSRGETSRN